MASTIKLQQLDMLVTVIDCGGFSAASTELGCTQSRISHAIQELETHLGVRLLNRHRNGCTPTPAGLQVSQQARQIQRLVQGIESGMANQVGQTGLVKIACFRSVSTHLLPSVLEALAIDHPGLQIEVDDSCKDSIAVNERIESGEADLGISSYHIPTEWHSIPYLQDHFRLVLPSSWHYQLPKDWPLLKQQPYIESANAAAPIIRDACQAAGFPLTVSRQMNSDSGLLALIRQGLGFSIMSNLATFPTPVGVRQAPLPFRISRPLFITCTSPNYRSDLVQTTIRYLKDKSILYQTDAWRAGVIGIEGK
ncbi:LysR family transcriptional regulator [Leeia sp. TBRC 13508]|uniref:LysR family transcriptional regulator n=1 Tax=Leeia speluncae TaxID=2884804 RepID=A0ABS8D423_9NEIS|nr:LysR family transcriptional regulator [Leeia speluncae]MCB6182954.1 LysR family transcriptional regulator [Leeia speluncae]